MKDILLNDNTCAVIATYTGSKIIKKEGCVASELSPREIINKNCEYFGSSLEGRIVGSKTLIGVSYKVPIIISEHLNFIMFPTSSIKGSHCSWININHIDHYYSSKKDFVDIVFINKEKISINMSLKMLENQILKASRLKLVFLERKM